MTRIPFDEVESWLFEAAFPFWTEHGVDKTYGGFLEEVSPRGEATSCDFKRVRTLCRQTYAFSHAALMGYKPAEPLSEMGFAYLESNARLDSGAWVKVLARDGAVIDATPDLYDLAFVIFALAWRYRVSADTAALLRMHETLGFVQRYMSAGEGFVSRLPDDGVRLQNPHMHFLEACLAAFAATQDQRFLYQADKIVQLFDNRLFDGRTLGEGFDASWRRSGAQALEPGHHFEWTWLLAEHARLGGRAHAETGAALVEFADVFGVHPPSGAVLDAVSEDGRPLRQTSRVWPNTERIKGWLGLYELSGRDPRPAVTQSLSLLFNRYMAQSLPGAWIDQFDIDGRPLVGTVPASIVYHFLGAFSEVMRMRPALS